MPGIMSGMEIPSNTEICIYMAFLLKSLETERKASTNKEFCALYDRSEDVLNRLMNGEEDVDTPPAWATLSTCKSCAGIVMEAKLNSNETAFVIPKSLVFHSTSATHYKSSLNIEFDNMRTIVGYGQSGRRWLTHDVLCGKSISDVPELLKPLWLATYKPVNESQSIDILRNLLE